MTDGATPTSPPVHGSGIFPRRRRWPAALEARADIGGGILFFALCLFSWIGPLLYPHDPLAIHAHHILAAPDARFPLGTDALGRNVAARLMRGGQATLAISLWASAIGLLAGLLYGLTAGLGPAWLDHLLMRLLDALLAIPTLILMIFFAAIVPLNEVSLALLLGLVAWPPIARLVRNEAFAARERDYVRAARQFGAGRLYIARVHILRAMLPLVIVNATFLMADMILGLSGLSFLGLGIQPPHASWGGLLNSGAGLAVIGSWWLIVFPGLAIFLAILAMNMLGQGLLARLNGEERG
ncbi:ABC transporter permease [Acidiferrobacter sp.]|jgi:peptide/nickel transport system permease protein|uniref:ABC transporter permease n=1 Tax=Acidiferrobacter sp. TaxID=1872107 RepID=UPI00260675E9|nr:ABC transporter permease [Acidiferrobacter sp.]